MYSILTLLCFAGSLGFLCLKPMMDTNHIYDIKRNKSDTEEEVVGLLYCDALDTNSKQIENAMDNNSELSLSESIYKIFELWKDKRLWHLVPYTIYIGMD